MDALRTLGRWLMRGPKRKCVFAAATRLGVRALDGKIHAGPAGGLKFSGGDTLGYLLGSTEPAVQQAMVEHLGPGKVFFDVGANIGFHALIACRLVGPEGEVHAFEPLPANRSQLERNLAANGFRAHIHPVALSDRAGEGLLYLDRGLGQATLAPDGEIPVKCVRLDDLDVPTPDLVKIDVEGAETLVLEGARGVLAPRPTLIVETHGEPYKVKRVECLLDELGYRVTPLADNGGMPHLLATSEVA